MQNRQLLWSLTLAALLLAQSGLRGQIIANAEYFFDTDPGTGNGTAITVTPGDPVTFTATIGATGLLPGAHILFLRTRGDDGVWSLYEPRPFFVQQSIVEAEYFFDTDPGTGLASAITITPFLDAGTFTPSISTTGLAPGFHNLFIRTRDEGGHWSLFQPREFFIRQSITAAEYFFDTDPGIGSGTSLAVTPTLDQLSVSLTVSAAALSPGIHLLFIRTKDEKGKWSMYQPQEFYIETDVVAAEYFIDLDPGVGLGLPLAVPFANPITITPSLVTPSLPNGTHYLFVRSQDVFGTWSLFEPQSFVVDDALPIGLLAFEAHVTDLNQVKLTWTTETEINNDYFSVERATDGIHFSEIAKIKGAGNTHAQLQYNSLDRNPSNGTNYYQLRQTDYNGRFTFSNMVSVQLTMASGFFVYPNPVVQEWIVDFAQTSEGEQITVELFDVTGRKFMEENTMGGSRLRLGRNGISSGTYLLKISSDAGSSRFIRMVFM